MNKDRPNILFIPVDDLRPELRCYGREELVTPNIDRLAERGVVFSQAYCQVPVCGATRASLLTGVRPARDRFVDYMTWADHDLPGARTLPQHFMENGYISLANGKVFHHKPDTAERSWSSRPWHPNDDAFESWRNYILEENIKADASGTHRGPPVERAEVPDDAYYDGQIAEHALRDLRMLSEQDRPFFLAVGFLKPHLPFNAPAKYWDFYDRENINPAENPYRPADAPGEAMHDWGELRQYAGIPREGPLSDERASELIHGYRAATSYTDAQVGRILDELDRLGLTENTVVVLWGDHGWQLGEHGLWCKHCNFKTSLNAPLIISVPGLEGEKVSESLVEFVDIYPTLCELSGLTSPEHLDGDSLVPVINDTATVIKDATYSRYMSGDSVRSENYLYTEWTNDEGGFVSRMLYDHEADPGENRNIAELPENNAVVSRLSKMLHERIEASAAC